ncbi:MAG: hypothetical protein HYX25_10615 [Candidatus Solibacter usitatus]|nr:hypothetical protein [Candidatus Solibacter usitatus]
MPALLILAFISWLFGSGKSRSNSDAPLFNVVHGRQRKPWGGFALSMALHVAFLPILFLSPNFLADEDDQSLQRWMAGRALVIKLPDRLYLAKTSGESAATAARPARKLRISLRRAAEGHNLPENEKQLAAKLQKASPNPERFVRPVKNARRRFTLPDLDRLELRTQTLLQAELPNLPPQIEKSLPQLLFWAAEVNQVQPLKPQPVMPGNREIIAQRPSLDAPPTLSPPNREILTADLRIAAAPVQPRPALPRPAATTMPIQVPDPSPKPATPGPRSIDPMVGDPVHVLALSPNPAPWSETLKRLFVPAGNQMARLPGDAARFGDGQATEASRGTAAGTVVGNSAGKPPAATGGQETGSGSGNGTAGSTPADADLPEPPANTSEAVVATALPGEGAVLGLLTPPALPSAPVRMIHPVNGVFDVVVVQSSPSEAFPQNAASLSGRPVYTVYLQVGSAKEWILQYCVPNGMSGPIQAGNIVKLGNPTPLAAPYPVTTLRPPGDWRKGNGYLLVHGFLDTAGHFRDLSVVPDPDSSSNQGEALLEYLAQWEFRPALQDGRPVLVEVMLAVPPGQV